MLYDFRAPKVVGVVYGKRYFGIWGSWSGQGPDDSRFFVRDASTQEIYALEVDFP